MHLVRWSCRAIPAAILLGSACPVLADEPAQRASSREIVDDVSSPDVVGDDTAPPPPDPLGPDARIERWCAPEIEALADDVCALTPKREAQGPRTLVVFLHGVVKPDTSWQWAQQRGVARAAEAHGFTVIMPRGRALIGPKGMETWWTWPTSATAQAKVEDELLAEWEGARTFLEDRSTRPFERVWVFGFSNGAYYATSLAMRGRLARAPAALHADGFAAFAGGSGASYLQKAGRETKSRAPFFVAWGEKDPAHADQVSLAKMLRGLDWPSKSESAKRAGHAMTDKQVSDAVRFLDVARRSDEARATAPVHVEKRRAPNKSAGKTPSRSKKGAR